jgi:predicted transcriptional regulator
VKAPMPIRQFAKELGVSEGAVRKAIKAERIPKEALGTVKVGARTMPAIVNVDLAARCYRAGTQHSKGHQAGRGGPATPELQKANFATAMFRAKREQMRFEKEAGLLVPRHKVILILRSECSKLKKRFTKKEAALIDSFEKRIKAQLDSERGGSSEDAKHT